MTDSCPIALRLALSLPDPDTADALAERLRPELPAALSDRFGLPEQMIEELLDGDAVQMRAALSIDPGEWLPGAAELGDPVVGRALWDAVYRNDRGHQEHAMAEIPGLLAAVLAAADLSDPGWYEDGGLFEALHDVTGGPLLVDVLTSGYVGVPLGSIALFGVHLPPGAAVDACLHFQEIWGTEGITRFLDLLEKAPDLDIGHPWLPGLLRQALEAPDAAAFLKEHRPAGWTDPEHLHALLELRYGDRIPAKPDGLVWHLILREHERLPFGQDDPRYTNGLLRLITWEGCPAELVMESFGKDPYNTANYAAELPFEALTRPVEYPYSVFTHDLKHSIRTARLSVDRILAEVAPAEGVLWHLPDDHEPTRRALAGVVARLGTNPVNWLTCYARMERSPRLSVAELVADAASTDTRKKRYTSWPQPEEASFPTTFPDGSRRKFLRMLQCASEEAQLAVVPYLDALAVQDLLVHEDPSPALREAVVAAHGLPALVAMASPGSYFRDTLSAEKLEYLLELDEPAVDAQLFRYADLDRSERERILAGRLRGGGTRPLPEELIAVLGLMEDPHWLRTGLELGHPRVARDVLGRLQPQVPATRLRLLVAVWERGGPDAVREILAMERLPVTLRRRTEKLLDAPDGLERLRAQLAEEETPDRLLAFLTRSVRHPKKQLDRLVREGLEPPWSALLAAHRAGTLSAGLMEALIKLPDCPHPLLLAALGTVPESEAKWLDDALKSGRLTPEDILTHMAPAHAALHRLQRHADDRPDAQDRLPVGERAAALAREHLATDVEAWSVCLQLLPTFDGTLSALLATAGARMRIQD
ncbi:hypothetical protein AB0D04_31665 [Streptomyces sp. NPDC048483]|uniref:hypothetical protein n=1 Tax=Streptomyces sp. NPDC048483 TaxID=3154927 RepID=UPI0034481B2F